MIPELVESAELRLISSQIDTDLGQGVTRALLDDKVPVKIQKESQKTIYLISQSWLQYIKQLPSGYTYHTMGLQLGNLTEDKFKLSLAALEKLSGLTSNIVKVSEHGALLFTYGRSILKESIIELDSSLGKNSKVIVLDENSECLGLAELSVDASKVHKLRPEKLVAKNISDIGLYIRQRT